MVETLLKTLEVIKKEERIQGRLIQKNEPERLFYAVILEPMTDVTPNGDAHGDIMTAEEIRKTAHSWMLNGGVVYRDHTGEVNVKPVETFIAPVDYTPEGSDEVIKKGSWVAGVKVLDDEMWEGVESGEYMSFSPGGYGYRRDVK